MMSRRRAAEKTTRRLSSDEGTRVEGREFEVNTSRILDFEQPQTAQQNQTPRAHPRARARSCLFTEKLVDDGGC